MGKVWWILLLLAVTACAGPSSVPAAGPAQPSSPPPFKTLVLATLNATKSYSSYDIGSSAGGGVSLTEVHTMGLTVQDDQGNVSPRIATKLPSLDDGSLVVLPDGRMETTWKIRPDVTWQDGVPFTTEDIAFTWGIYQTRALLYRSVPTGFMERIDVLDPLTVKITWKTTYYAALNLHQAGFWLLPKHLLNDAPLDDIDTFRRHPYFTTDYVHLGPFRVVDWGQGENQVFERYPGYFLGSPKVDRIIIKTIANPLNILTELKAGTIDIAAEKTLLTDSYADLAAEWKQSGQGTLLSRQENWRYLLFQLDPRWARPIELSQDVRLRRGLMLGWDRNGLRDLIFPGIDPALTNGDSFMERGDPKAPTVGEPFAPFPFDPTRAAQELASGGWTRASDGRLLNPAGQQVHVEIRGNTADLKEIAIVAAGWQGLGVDVAVANPPPALVAEKIFSATFEGAKPAAQGNGEGAFGSFDGRNAPTPENNWQGNNEEHYVNPAFDRLLDQLYKTINPTDQALIIRDAAAILVADLPAIPMYFRVSFMAVRHTVKGPIYEDYPSSRQNTGGSPAVARNAHLWDRAEST